MEQLVLPAKLENLDALLDFIRQGMARAGFDKAAINKTQVAAEEVIVNVIHYAYSGGQGDITIGCGPHPEPKGLIIEIIDQGMAFNPLDKPDPDIKAPVAERPIGGLGIFLTKQIMNKVLYERKDGQNRLTMIKYL